jgi:Ni,Fe-hydrogenase I large subunit
MARSLEARSLPLLPHGDRHTLEPLAAAMIAEQDFETLPNWQGGCCETGTWTRLANAGRSLEQYGRRAWFRLGARVAEAALLARGTQGVLSVGAMQLSLGHGIAWCEMARGLLLHRVHLEQQEEQDLIADYRIVAPTEWNIHPGGAAAEMLARIPARPGAGERESLQWQVNLVAAAFDPCVAFEVETENA